MQTLPPNRRRAKTVRRVQDASLRKCGRFDLVAGPYRREIRCCLHQGRDRYLTGNVVMALGPPLGILAVKRFHANHPKNLTTMSGAKTNPMFLRRTNRSQSVLRSLLSRQLALFELLLVPTQRNGCPHHACGEIGDGSLTGGEAGVQRQVARGFELMSPVVSLRAREVVKGEARRTGIN
jgi:hypothetical protein